MFGYSAHHPILYPIYPDHTHTHTHTHTRCLAFPLHNPPNPLYNSPCSDTPSPRAVWVPTPRTTCTPTPTTQRDVADVADDDDDDAHGCRRRHRIARASRRRRRRHRRRRRQRRCGARQHHQGWLRAHGEKGEPDAERRARGAV